MRSGPPDPDTRPVFFTEDPLAAGRRVEPDAIEDVPALRSRLELSQENCARRFVFSVDTVRL